MRSSIRPASLPSCRSLPGTDSEIESPVFTPLTSPKWSPAKGPLLFGARADQLRPTASQQNLLAMAAATSAGIGAPPPRKGSGQGPGSHMGSGGSGGGHSSSSNPSNSQPMAVDHQRRVPLPFPQPLGWPSSSPPGSCRAPVVRRGVKFADSVLTARSRSSSRRVSGQNSPSSGSQQQGPSEEHLRFLAELQRVRPAGDSPGQDALSADEVARMAELQEEMDRGDGELPITMSSAVPASLMSSCCLHADSGEDAMQVDEDDPEQALKELAKSTFANFSFKNVDQLVKRNLETAGEQRHSSGSSSGSGPAADDHMAVGLAELPSSGGPPVLDPLDIQNL